MQGRGSGSGSGGAAIPTIPPTAIGCLVGSQPSPPPLLLSASSGAPPLVVVVAVGFSPLPLLSLVPHPTVIVTVGAWWVALAMRPSPLVHRAEGHPRLVLM